MFRGNDLFVSLDDIRDPEYLFKLKGSPTALVCRYSYHLTMRPCRALWSPQCCRGCNTSLLVIKYGWKISPNS